MKSWCSWLRYRMLLTAPPNKQAARREELTETVLEHTVPHLFSLSVIFASGVNRFEQPDLFLALCDADYEFDFVDPHR